MRVIGIAWLGTRTDRFDEMREFFRELTGVAPREEQGLAAFELASGDRIEVLDPAVGESYMVAPVAGFLVEDVAAARAELESRGIEFLGPIQTGAGSSWSHFRAPDGHVYELTELPGHPAYGT
jgi:hypothetical protein